MGSQKTPQTYSPGEAAQAAVGTAAAGEMQSVANQPIDQYGNLMTTEALGPAEMQTQQALANQAALQGAKAQMDIQSQVDPQAYAQRQIRMNMANKRLGQLAQIDPQTIGYSAPSAYTVPGSSSLPSLAALKANANAVASQLSTASVNKAGADPRLSNPAAGGIPYPTYNKSYLG